MKPDQKPQTLRSPLSRPRERGLGGEGSDSDQKPQTLRSPLSRPRERGLGGEGSGSKLVLPRASKTKLGLAREFRKDPTAAEARAWQILRNRQVLGLKFRRQKVIHGFVVDFYCAEHALVVEIDGSIHAQDDIAKADAERTQALERFGITVLRIQNDDTDAATLTQRISQALAATEGPNPK